MKKWRLLLAVFIVLVTVGFFFMFGLYFMYSAFGVMGLLSIGWVMAFTWGLAAMIIYYDDDD